MSGWTDHQNGIANALPSKDENNAPEGHLIPSSTELLMFSSTESYAFEGCSDAFGVRKQCIGRPKAMHLMGYSDALEGRELCFREQKAMLLGGRELCFRVVKAMLQGVESYALES